MTEFDKYWLEVFEEDINKIVEVTGSNGDKLKCNLIEGELTYLFDLQKCECRVAELEGKIIGFMFYHLIFDCVLVTRAICFSEPYRNSKLLRKMVLGISPSIRRVLSQTRKLKNPKNIRGEKPMRKKIFEGKEFIVWENIIRDKGFFQI